MAHGYCATISVRVSRSMFLPLGSLSYELCQHCEKAAQADEKTEESKHELQRWEETKTYLELQFLLVSLQP
jgi:hypothetical protein